jgi:cytochrome bd ubiquinol oxidase subunit I
LKDNFAHFGYGYYAGRDMNEMIPNVPTTFYSFRIMVLLGIHFIVLFIVVLILTYKGKMQDKRFILKTALWSIPLAYLSSELGWVVAEVGRQPWVIQDLLPTIAAVSKLQPASVRFTFMLFLVIFTGLLAAEIKIMVAQIKKGPSAEPSVQNK